MSIQTETHKKVRDALLIAGCMDSNASLRAMFVDARLAPWKSQVPEANNKGERVAYTISTFVDKFNTNQQNMLAVLLEVIGQREVGMLANNLLELAQQVQYETTGTRGVLDSDYKRNAAIKNVESLFEEYQAVQNQLASVLDAVSRVRLQRQIEKLEWDIDAISKNFEIQNPLMKETQMYNTQTFDNLATQLIAVRALIAVRKEFGLKVSEELLAEGRKIRAAVEAAAAAEKQSYAESVKRQLREVETAEEKRARLKKELEELDTGDTQEI